MTYYNREDQFLRQRLQKEIPILRALIQNLYEELDRKLHLNGAKVPITFGYDTDTLGSYTRRSAHEKEHFHFSLLFIAYGVKNPLSKEERIDANNGLLLCANHDALFDRHLISFEPETGNICISASIDDDQRNALNLSKSARISMNERMKAYMQIHYKKFIKKENQ